MHNFLGLPPEEPHQQLTQSFLAYNIDNKVCVNDVFSVSRDGNCGVPQGFVLGARLYT